MIRLKLNFVRRERERKSPNTNEFTPKKRRGRLHLIARRRLFMPLHMANPGERMKKIFFPFRILALPLTDFSHNQAIELLFSPFYNREQFCAKGGGAKIRKGKKNLFHALARVCHMERHKKSAAGN